MLRPAILAASLVFALPAFAQAAAKADADAALKAAVEAAKPKDAPAK